MNSSEINILLVEDNPGDAFLVEELLKEATDRYFNITISKTLGEALHELQNSSCHIILLDLGLPDAVGLQALEKILQTVPDKPVVVITGLNDEMVGQQAVQIGAQGYMVKGDLSTRSIVQSILYSIDRAEILGRIKKREKELQKKNNQLNEALGAKDLLFSVISHDLKGPVNSIVSLLDILFADYDEIPDESKKKYIESVLRSAQNTQQLILNLLEWAQTQTNRRIVVQEKVDLASLVKESVDAVLASSATKLIDIENQVAPGHSFYGDKSMISTVIRNLLSNAVKFTHRNGRIVIKSIPQNDDEMAFSIRDNGIGMEKGILENIFKVRKTASQPGTENELGSGFGLMLCRDFVEKNNGRIWFESTPGTGTEVFVALPAVN